MKPLYDHDCVNCEYLGTDKKETDWYICSIEDSARTIVRRFSSKPSNYSSVTIGESVKITQLETLALRMGLKLTEKELIMFGQRYIRSSIQYSSIKDSVENGPDCEDENLLGD